MTPSSSGSRLTPQAGLRFPSSGGVPPPPPVMPAPTFSPDGSPSSNVNVTISCPDVGAHIFYTVGANPPDPTHTGDTPTGGTLRIGAASGIVNSGSGVNKIKALAYRNGATDSPIEASNTYGTMTTLARPTFNPDGSPNSNTDVLIGCSISGPHLFYTFGANPPDPTHSGDTPTGPTIRIGSEAGIVNSGPGVNKFKALAYQSGFNDSAIAISNQFGTPLQPYLVGIGMLTSSNEIAANWSNGTYYGWDNPDVRFVRARFTWDFIQPNGNDTTGPGWDSLAALFAQAHAKNKRVSLNIGAGTNTPQPVYDAGATKYNIIGTTLYEPLPWETAFQTPYFALIDLLGARYGNDSLFANLWACGFMQAGDMLFGGTADESSTTGMPHIGYPSVDAAYIAGAEAVLTHTMNALPLQKVMVNYVRAFPSAQGLTDATTVKNFLIDSWPTRGGSGVSAIYAASGFGAPAPPTQNGHGYPHGGQQVQPCNVHGAFNPNVYQGTPPPGQTIKGAFLDMGGNARAGKIVNGVLLGGNLFIEVYQSDLQDATIQSVLASENALYDSIVPT